MSDYDFLNRAGIHSRKDALGVLGVLAVLWCVVLLALAGCHPALLRIEAPAAADPVVAAWQQQMTDRAEDLTHCVDVQVRQCVLDREKSRKEHHP